MAAKAIREHDGKAILAYWLPRATRITAEDYVTECDTTGTVTQLAQISFDAREAHTGNGDGDGDGNGSYEKHVAEVLDRAESVHGWLRNTKLVAKPDQLIKRRGKSGLLCLNADWPTAREWIAARAGKAQQVEHVTGTLRTFLVEPFCPHKQDAEYYVTLLSDREGDEILFTHEGGVDVGDVDAKARRLAIPVDLAQFPSRLQIASALLPDVPEGLHDVLVDFISRLYAVFVQCGFTYLEINPLVVIPTGPNSKTASVHYLDLAAKLDQTAEFEAGSCWSAALKSLSSPLSSNGISSNGKGSGNGNENPKEMEIEFPAPFGRELSPEERYIAELDAKTGASLKLTILNPRGRIWTLVAGGGASVVYADAIAGSGFAAELANYGEYSGAPSETQTYEYAKTVLDLMTRDAPHKDGKVLFIGGGIANFTNVASTFRGIIRALRDFQAALRNHKVQIWVRRAGPNFQEGLRSIKAVGEELDLQLKVYGPETHVSGIVPMALVQGYPVAKEWSG